MIGRLIDLLIDMLLVSGLELVEENAEEQCDFRKGRSCVDAIFENKRVIETRK